MWNSSLFRKSLVEGYAIGTNNILLSRWILKWKFIKAGIDPETVDEMTLKQFKLYDALREADERLKKKRGIGNDRGK